MSIEKPDDHPHSSDVESREPPETVPTIKLTPEDEAQIMAGGTLPDGTLPDDGFMGCYC